MAAAAVGLVVGLGVGELRDAVPPVADPAVVAQAPLEPVGDVRVEGVAVLTESAGGRNIEMDLGALPAPAAGSYYEVWLIDREVAGLVSLGPLEAGRTTFAVPSGLDVAAYPVVDVSVETFDGNPGHSSDSVVRGILPV